MFPNDADNAQDLLKNADTAMYHAKSEGRDNFKFYAHKLNETALENITLEHELSKSIANNELIVYYQPKVDVTGHIVGAEALIRWQHPKLGMVSPGKFIPLAEQTGLIVEIGYWVFEQACHWVNFCHTKSAGHFRVSVNLSAIQFKHPDLVTNIAAIMAKTGVNPKCIELELTESVTIGNTENSILRMNQLKELGLTLAMDDFGTGFSSLSYLKKLPLDVLKIDQSFVRPLESESKSQAIAQAIITLASGLNMDVIAEGVETKAQLDLLKQHNCHLFQGFLFSRPIPPEEFLPLLLSNSPLPTSHTN
jgi:EAL domain-containing protein (putative c-di-GMP-specific phosphodiesterase class I)